MVPSTQRRLKEQCQGGVVSNNTAGPCYSGQRCLTGDNGQCWRLQRKATRLKRHGVRARYKERKEGKIDYDSR
ncbi:Hypothetical predicted protein [Olea europaea subsp. europaea]|uniref:Uncharacterized protein n=1 Tax=Olea europaea subsp. europaea TaxID=158383 RepID=A0A8S0S4M1_OLEEU|nr:Hypothetical predicted protein [Olea europaea subsp. europaea]